MKDRSLIWITFYFNRIVAAKGAKKISYAIGNAVILALDFAFLWCLVWLFSTIGDSAANVLLNWLGILVCIAGVVYATFQGVIGQLIVIVTSCIGMCRKSEPQYRKPCAVAFAIGLLTLIAAIVGTIVFFVTL